MAFIASIIRSASYCNLFFGLLVCFLVGEWRSNKLKDFVEHAGILLLADICCVPLAICCLLFWAFSLRNAFRNGLGGMVWAFIWAMSMLFGFWICMIKISEIHKLHIVCAVPNHPSKAYCAKPPKHISIFEVARWFPLELYENIGHVVLLPWHLLRHMADPFFRHGWAHVLPVGWDQWRLVLVSSVFWSCFAAMIAIVALSTVFQMARGQDQLYLLVCGIWSTFFAVYITFIVTSPPMLSFWHYLARVGTFHWGYPTLLTLEEFVAVLLLLWLITRLVHAAMVAQLEEWDAKARVEESMRFALRHPFRAEFEEDWEKAALGRTLRRTVGGVAGMLRREQLAGLAQKQKSMTEARQQMLRDSVADPYHDLPDRLMLNVNRETIVQDSLKAIFDSRPPELLAPYMVVFFEGEEGFDAGGLTRDWFDSMAKAFNELAEDGNTGILTTAPDGTLTLRPKASDEREHPNKFRSIIALGRFLALAVFRERPLPLSFSLLLCKHILKTPVGMDDVRRLDPMFYQHRVETVLREDGLAEMEAALGEPLTFMSAPTEFRRVPEELVPGGEQRLVTEDNKKQYLQLLCEHYLCGDIRREIQCMLQGFWEIMPLQLLQALAINPRELSVLISGIQDLDPLEWRRHSLGSEGTPQHAWFWDAIWEMGAEDRCMLLHFATGSSRLPPGGFAKLQPKFMCEVTCGIDNEHLPHAHTCVNKIVLHRYPSKEVLKKKLSQAIRTQGFDFA